MLAVTAHQVQPPLRRSPRPSPANSSIPAGSPSAPPKSPLASARPRRGALRRGVSGIRRVPRPDATPDLTPETVRAYRDALERAGRSSATAAKHLSALRGLAEALGVETQQLRTVRSERVGRGEPRALTHDEWSRLLRMPDRRTRQASATSRCCTYSVPPACGAPKPPTCL
jgi:integrase